MKILIAIFLGSLLIGCTTTQYIPVPKPVYVWVPIPSDLLVTCPGATWQKGITWRQMAVNSKVDQAANQAYAVYMQSIKTLVSSTPAAATANFHARISPKISQLCTPLK